MRPMLMSDLVLRCRRRADMEGDDVVGPTEWKGLISEMYAQLYAIVGSAGMLYFESPQTVTATGAASYALPSDHDETIGIDRVVDPNNGFKMPLGELMVQERTRMSGTIGDATAYAIIGQTIVLYPIPASGTYLHTYVPQSPDISTIADTTTVDLVTGDGEAFLIWGVAVKTIPKRNGDPQLAIVERDAAERRSARAARRRARATPRRRVPVAPPLGAGVDGYDWEYNDPGAWHWRFGR